MKDCCPKHMPRTVGKGDTAKAGHLTKDGVKRMPRSAGSLKIHDVGDKRTGEITLTHTTWRHKSKEDPAQVEYKKLLSGMGFANL